MCRIVLVIYSSEFSLASLIITPSCGESRHVFVIRSFPLARYFLANTPVKYELILILSDEVNCVFIHKSRRVFLLFIVILNIFFLLLFFVFFVIFQQVNFILNV